MYDPPSSHEEPGSAGTEQVPGQPQLSGISALTKTPIKAQRGFSHQFPESESAVRKSQIFFLTPHFEESEILPPFPIPVTGISISIVLMKKLVPCLKLPTPA